MKRILSVFLATFMFTMLAACGSSAKAETTSTQAVTEAQTAAAQITAAESTAAAQTQAAETTAAAPRGVISPAAVGRRCGHA